jgi:hypothetical protein
VDDNIARFATVVHGIRDSAAPLSRSNSNLSSGNRNASPSVEADGPDETDRSTPSQVFVSWAHSGEGWSQGRSAAWAREVVEFTAKLRNLGVDAELDLFHTHEPAVDWTRFGPQQVSRAEFVIVALSQAWAQRWDGTNTPTVGAGAVGEADALKGLFQSDQAEWQRKVLLVILPSQAEFSIPLDLFRLNRFHVDPDDLDSYDDLLRTMTAQPLYVKPQLGVVPILPPTVTKTLNVRTSSSRTDEYSAYLALRKAVDREKKLSGKDGSSGDQLATLQGLLDALNE